MSAPIGRIGDWVQTYTGKQFWPLDPRTEDVDIRDIAHGLAAQCRFAGHSLTHYSVAQHSVLVSQAVPREVALWGLLHDASEAYLMDIPRPLKRLPAFAEYLAIEERLQAVICLRFGLWGAQPDAVTRADFAMLANEKRDVMAPEPAPWNAMPEADPALKIVAMSAPDAERLFLERFAELTGAPR